MRVKITYMLTADRSEQNLEDVLNWPDVESLEGISSHAEVYLDAKYGSGQYTVIAIEEHKSVRAGFNE